MTREEAIEVLTRIHKCVYVGNELFEAEKEQAIEIAIEALNREPSEDGTLEVKVEDATKIGRVLISDDKHRGGLYYPDEDEPQGISFENDTKIKSCSKDSDLISRAEAIEAIENTDWYHQNQNKDMVSGANDYEHQAWYKADDVYKTLEAVPSANRPKDGDLISRTETIEALGEEPPVWCDEEYEIAERNQWRADVEAIKSVPSADRPQPIEPTITVDLESGVVPLSACEPKGPKMIIYADRPKGEWIHTPNGIDRDFVWWTCSECGHKIFSETEKDRIEFHAYCGRCGADMRGDTK